MSNEKSVPLQISLFRSQIEARRFHEGTIQILQSLLVSKDVNSLKEVRSALKEFMRTESLFIIREISQNSVEHKLLCADFLVRVFALIGDVESCLALMYEALLMREKKAATNPSLEVSYSEWLTFAEHAFDFGFSSTANKACEKALFCFNNVPDSGKDNSFHNVNVIEKIKRLKDVSVFTVSSRSVQAQTSEYLKQKAADPSMLQSALPSEIQSSGSSRFRSGIRKRNLRMLSAYQCLG